MGQNNAKTKKWSSEFYKMPTLSIGAAGKIVLVRDLIQYIILNVKGNKRYLRCKFCLQMFNSRIQKWCFVKQVALNDTFLSTYCHSTQ
jgi:hypothetical protein